MATVPAQTATSYPELFAALAAQFDKACVKKRTGTGGKSFNYVTARVVMNRLDDTIGPENWWDEYVPGENSVLCRLTIKLADGSTITKSDAGGYAGMPDSGDDDKSGYSDAFKRAAVKFGVGRYLYDDGVPDFVRELVGHSDVPYDSRDRHDSEPPRDYEREPARGHDQRNGSDDGQRSNGANGTSSHGGGSQKYGTPKNGKALFAWVKEQEKTYNVDLLKALNQWAKTQEYPARMVDWNDNEVAIGYQEAARLLAPISREGGNDER